MLNTKSVIRTSLIAFAGLLGVGTVACNKETAGYEELEMYTSSTAVESFSLKANSKVMENLDSVFFAIDLENGVIFNADSLPKGTNIRTLIPVIKLNSAIKEASIEMSGGEYRVGIVDYLTNPSDSIDFTGSVKLNLTAYNGTERSYRLKVNVHQMEPDSVIWNDLATTKLPSRLAHPIAQKTLFFQERTVCLVEESDGSYTLAETASPTMDRWSKTDISTTLPVGADVRTLEASESQLYLLAEGQLYAGGLDGIFAPVATEWVSLLGGFGDSVLGVSRDGSGNLVYDKYPASDDFEPYPMDADFPLNEGSNLCVFKNKWSTEPIVFFVGGCDLGGKSRAAVWGFDGDRWTQMSVSAPPALENATVVPYYVYIQTSAMWRQEEISAWLLIGGRDSEGCVNRDVYISYDTGVSWHKAPDLMQLPEGMPALFAQDNVVTTSPYRGNLSSAWETRASHAAPRGWRINYDVEGYEISWECPYIYLFGGMDENWKLNDTIWRGVLSRMTFIPVI